MDSGTVFSARLVWAGLGWSLTGSSRHALNLKVPAMSWLVAEATECNGVELLICS